MSRSYRTAVTACTLGLGLAAMTAVLPSSSAAAEAPTHSRHGTDHFVAKSRAAEGDGTTDHYCDGCTPPLEYSGGPVLDTTGDTGLTITPIYWAPADATPFPDTYQPLINRYITDVAAASGSTDNVYAINAEYYQDIGGTQTNLDYKITAGEPIVDTEPFPADGCTPEGALTNCITDDQLRAELVRITSELGLTTDLANFYPVFLPPGVETQDLDGSTSASAYCGYHRAFDSDTGVIVYGNEPYEEEGCDGGQAPNGDIVADLSLIHI